jgi:uncharacterized protein (UPF0147 family)
MMVMMDGVVEALVMLKNDTGVPKNIKAKITVLIEEINGNNDRSMVVNKMLSELEDISSDINLQPFVRTQLFNISSMLESFQ